MTFTRTVSGLRNYNWFYKTEAIVYIEGRLLEQENLDDNNDNSKVFDVLFYTSLSRMKTC